MPSITIVWHRKALRRTLARRWPLIEFGAVDLRRHLKRDFHRIRHHKVCSVVLYRTRRIPSAHPVHFEPIPGHATLWYAQSAAWAQWWPLIEHAPYMTFVDL